METFGFVNKGNAAVVNPHKIHGTVMPSTPENLGPRVLELSGILQTTLDLETQVDLLGKELQRELAIDGLHYRPPGRDWQISFGREGTHRANYDLKLESQALGAVQIHRDLPYTDGEVASLENLLCALVYPLRNALTYLQAVELASRDPLTGVQNRMALESSLIREVDLAKRKSLPLSMLVIDIDHFKRFNDDFGHAFGDDVLQAVSQTVANTIRRSDLLFRFGGEEFVVLTSHTDEQGAMLLAQRIRENVAAMQTVRGRRVGITVSLGVTSLQEADDAEQFFDRADKALYQAKNNGRNRCVAS
jgi:diguanylate cyclase (GGDEF)-like protein